MRTEKRVCEKHGEYEASIFEGPFVMASECPKCLAEFEDAEACERETVNTAADIERWKGMNIPPLYYSATLANFDAYNVNLKAALDSALALVSGKYQSLVFVGSPGTGKTHLAIGALKRLGGAIHRMYRVSCQIRATYTPASKETEEMVLDRMANYKLLCIDEIGKSKGSDSELSWLSDIIDTSHSNGNKIILISNNHLRGDCPNGAKGCASCLENYLGDDMISRLSERGAVVKFEAKDYRRA